MAYFQCMHEWPIRGAFCLFSALLALACAGGQTGEEEGSPCREQRQKLTFEETSPLGFSAQELLAVTGSGFSLPLTWQPAADIDYGPESGASTLTLRLENARDPVYIASEHRAPAGIEDLACADSVVVTAEATLSSAGGALEESFQATLAARTADTVLLLQDFDPASLSGSLSLTPELPTTRVPRISLQARWGAAGASGGLFAGLEQRSADSASFRLVPIGCFGTPAPSSACPP